jgi:hypothetical protein
VGQTEGNQRLPLAIATDLESKIINRKSDIENALVTPARFERAAYSLEGCCSIQLSYGVSGFCSCSKAMMQILTESVSGFSKRHPLTHCVRGQFWNYGVKKGPSERDFGCKDTNLSG